MTVELRYATPHVAVVTLDNPPANTLDAASRHRFAGALDELGANLDVRCVVVTGAGRAFTAGADLRDEMAMPGEAVGEFLAEFDRILLGLESFRAPVIAAVNGPAVGGGFELAMACDIRVASSEAFFVAAGVNVGLVANFWRLPRITGLGPAKEILLTGGRCRAEQALAWGLVTEVHPPERLLPAALEKAERIASRAPLSVEATKECVNLALDVDEREAGRMQVERFARLLATEDHREALRAFFGKRAGEFRRR